MFSQTECLQTHACNDRRVAAVTSISMTRFLVELQRLPVCYIYFCLGTCSLGTLWLPARQQPCPFEFSQPDILQSKHRAQRHDSII